MHFWSMRRWAVWLSMHEPPPAGPRMHQRQELSPRVKAPAEPPRERGYNEQGAGWSYITRLPPETVSSQAWTAARRTEGRPVTEFKTDDKRKVNRC